MPLGQNDLCFLSLRILVEVRTVTSGAVLFRRPLLWRLAVLGDGQTSRGRGATVDVMEDMIYKLIVT